MPDIDVSTLVLNIKSESKGSAGEITALQKSLEKLGSTVNNLQGLKSIANGFRAINNAAASGQNVAGLISSLQGLNNIKLPAATIKNLETLKLTLSDFNVPDLSGIKTLSSDLAMLSNGDYKNIGSLSKNLESLYPPIVELSGLDWDSVGGGLGSMVSALSQLQGVEKADGLNSTVKTLKKLPEMFEDLKSVDLDAFENEILRLSNALAPLATQVDKIGNAFAKLPQNVSKATRSAQTLNKTTKKSVNLGNSLKNLFNFALINRGARLMGQAVNSVSEYIESVNLFTVSMGRYSKEAAEFAETAGELMGIDPGEWMKSQGVFMTLISGFGVANDRAKVMSQNLTQLGYDLSSFFNIDIQDAMQKLQSGISGELEPLRRLGYDLSQARLQAIALELGIEKAFKEMTQAEKSQLRYYAIMKQVTVAQGDMARTLDAPANQLRILKAQLMQAARAIGSIFIPALNAILPYAIAAVKVFREMASELAWSFGFEMPDMDYSGIEVPNVGEVDGIGDVTSDLGDISDALGDATESAEKFKGSLAGFDELNIIGSISEAAEAAESAGSIGDEIDTSGWKDFDLPEYNFLADKINERVENIVESLRKSIPTIKRIGKVLLAAFAGVALFKGIKAVTDLIDMIKASRSLQIGVGIALMLTGFTMLSEAARAIGYGNADIKDYVMAAIGSALGVAGSLIVFGTGPLGWTIGIGAALTVFIVNFAIGRKEALRDKIRSEFFDGVGKPISEIAEGFNEAMSGITLKYNPVLEVAQTVETANEAVQKATTAAAALMLSMEEGSVVTQEKAEEIETAFGNLYDVMEEKLSASDKLIETYIVTAMQNAATSVGISVNSMLGELARLTGENQTRLTELRTLSQNLIESMEGMEVGSAEYNAARDQLGEYVRESLALTNSLSEGAYAFATLKEQFAQGMKINFEDVDSMKEAIASMSEAAQEAKDALEQSFATVDAELLGKIEYAKEFAPEQVEVWEEIRETLKNDFENQKALIDKDLQYMYQEMGVQANEHFIDSFITAPKAYQNFTGALEWGKIARGAIIAPMLEEMRSSGGEVGKAAADSIDEAFQKTTGTLALGAEEIFSKYGGDLFGLYGSFVECGMGKIAQSVKDELRSELPGWEASGEEVGETISNGIGNGMAEGLFGIGKRIRAWWDKFELPVPKVSGRGGANFGDWQNVPIPKFANGGFPRRGSLFLAGEGNGAEIVGSMGGHTAVANGDQIVQGIASGVAHANDEQNALLREQNALLRALVEQGGEVVFTPSAAAGRAIKRSIEMFDKQRGYA